MLVENNRQQILLDFLNQLEENNCIITVGKRCDFIPAVFRQGTKYQVYIDQFSQFHDYEDVTILIDKIIRYVPDNEFIEYKLISIEEFGQKRINDIRNNIQKRLDNIDAPENQDFKNIISDVERDISTYVLADGKIKYLVGAVSTDEDWYYMYLIPKNASISVEYGTCVGFYIPLHRYLPAEEYERVHDYTITKALKEENLEKTKQWFYNKFVDTTDMVPFTNVGIKPGEWWEPFSFLTDNNTFSPA